MISTMLESTRLEDAITYLAKLSAEHGDGNTQIAVETLKEALKAQHVPEECSTPEEGDESASLWDHGFRRGWNACRAALLTPSNSEAE